MNARVATILAVLLAWLAGFRPAPAAAPRPNILFILCDDLGYGDVGVFFQNLRQTANNRAEPWHFTPHLDTLAAEGVQLPGHYCPAPVCAPSRATLLLGVHQGHANVRDNQFDKELEDNHTVATVLRQAGYATACIGKWGLQGSGTAPDWPAHPLKRGFDFYHGYIRHADGHAHYPKEDGNEVWENYTNIATNLAKCYTTDLFTARAKKWIVDHQAAQPAQPFFLYLAYDTPHAALQLPTVAYPAGGGLTGGLQWLGTPGAMINTATGVTNSYYHPDYAAATYDHDTNAATPEVAWPDVQRRYATDVRRIDDGVGDLMTLLKDLNLDQNTLVVFTSDNGPSQESYLPENYDPNFFHGFGPFDGIKRDCWEGGVRVGALARWPDGIPGARVNPLPCSAADWMATFAEVAGVPCPARSDGVSLVPALTGTGAQRTPRVYVEYYHNGNTPSYAEFDPARRGRKRNQMQVLRQGDYSAVRYNIQSQADDFEIYNVTTDPAERTNLATSLPALQAQVKDTVLRLRRPDAEAPRPYDGELVPALNPAPSPVTGGVQWQSYTQAFAWVPEFATMTPAATGTHARPDLSVRPRNQDFGLLFTGLLQVPAAGDYTFYLTVSGGALLRIHEATVLDADKPYTPGTELAAVTRLASGWHPFRLYFVHGASGTPNLSLQWSGPGFGRQDISAASWLREGSGPPLAPLPVPDTASTTPGVPVTIPVLQNDLDDGLPQALTLLSVGTPMAGSAVIVSNQVRYTPNTNFLGRDTFSYVFGDGLYTATGRVSVDVCFVDNQYWYPFDQTNGLTTPEAGGGRYALLSGYASDTAPWVPGRSGWAITFDGTSDALTIPGFAGYTGAAPRSVAAWLRTTNTGANRAIVGWGQNSNSRKWSFLMNTNGQLRLEVSSGAIVGSRKVNDAQWHHAACAFPNDGTPNIADAKLYVDGVPDTLSAVTSNTVDTAGAGEVQIGCDVQSRYWKGDLDEVRLFDRALSAGEVLALCQQTNLPALAWQRRYFGDAPVDWAADDDGDGLPRFVEYALGFQPRVADAGAWRPRAEWSAGRVRVRFPRRIPGSHAIQYQVLVSTNLLTWDLPLATEAGVESLPELPGFEEAVYAPGVSNAPRTFLRLQVFPLP